MAHAVHTRYTGVLIREHSICREDYSWNHFDNFCNEQLLLELSAFTSEKFLIIGLVCKYSNKPGKCSFTACKHWNCSRLTTKTASHNHTHTTVTSHMIKTSPQQQVTWSNPTTMKSSYWNCATMTSHIFTPPITRRSKLTLAIKTQHKQKPQTAEHSSHFWTHQVFNDLPNGNPGSFHTLLGPFQEHLAAVGPWAWEADIDATILLSNLVDQLWRAQKQKIRMESTQLKQSYQSSY